jgi:hypothetical protein
VLTLGGGSNGIPVTEKTANADKMARPKSHRRALLPRQEAIICSKRCLRGVRRSVTKYAPVDEDERDRLARCTHALGLAVSTKPRTRRAVAPLLAGSQRKVSSRVVSFVVRIQTYVRMIL